MDTEIPLVETPVRRQNHVAVLVAAIANFLLETVWYSTFYSPWLSGVGRTDEWLKLNSPNRALQFLTAIVASAVAAMGVSIVVQLTGPRTMLRGIKTGFWLWLGFVLTSFATEYVFEVRPFSLLGINTGFWLLGLMLMGGIVGGWKTKS